MTKAQASSEQASELESQPGDEQTSVQASQQLGVLNRHWYRRCLDELDENLRAVSANPDPEELQELCHKVLTGFLTALTGQAPESPDLQFPADRAYFVPFVGDRAGRFAFSKPFYRVSHFEGKCFEQEIESSLWSFFPWTAEWGQVGVNSARSVHDGRINTFEEMISAQAKFTRTTSLSGGRRRMLLEKSLILRPEDGEAGYEDFVDRLFADKVFRVTLQIRCRQALVEIFEIYRLTPGNVLMEHLLFNHLVFIRWALCMAGRTAERSGRDQNLNETLSQQEGGFRELLELLLLDYFAGNRGSRQEGVLEGLGELAEVVELASEEGNDEGETEEKETSQQPQMEMLRKLCLLFAELEGTRFSKKIAAGEDEEAAFEHFQLLISDLCSFRRYFLRAESEQRLEADLESALSEDLTKAGQVKQSFVWVASDFEGVERSISPGVFDIEKAPEIDKRLVRVCEPYRLFFQQADLYLLSTQKRTNKIDDYWRVQGDANRTKRVFASFENRQLQIVVPKMLAPKASRSALGARGERLAEDLTFVPNLRPRGSRNVISKGRPQNFFLRVKVCDSLNEPVINGLFIISTDHDETIFKGKPHDIRLEDRDDLLSFAKVYFFIIRDFILGLDRARTADDIGLLNQHLYDICLGDLEQRFQARARDLQGKNRNITWRHDWSALVYEAINNFAFSLIQKPPEVQAETFPYDRLFVLPLEDQSNGNCADLPFYLFQTIFVERAKGEVVEGRFSLIKPYQSPIDEFEGENFNQRFIVKSFRETSTNSGTGPEAYLQKHYLGAVEDPNRRRKRHAQDSGKANGENTHEPFVESFVVKLVEGDDVLDTATAENLMQASQTWVSFAVRTFWRQQGLPEGIEEEPAQQHLALWRSFLIDLTGSYRALRSSAESKTEGKAETVHGFLLGFGLLRMMLGVLGDEKGLEQIRKIYRRDLKLRFEDDEKLDIFRLARQKAAEVLAKLPAASKQGARRANRITFEEFELRGDGFLLRFFEHLTRIASNTHDQADKNRPATWYQSLLTRPFEELADGLSVRQLSLEAGNWFGKRIPPYARIRAREHSLSMFLGFVELEVSGGNQSRALRCLVAMIRDYDDTRTGAGLKKEEVKEQLKIDMRDLSLYTKTYFGNLWKFLTDTLVQEDNHLLLTEITQIARNWHSTGIDEITFSLRRKLRSLVDDRTDVRLGQLRPEVMDAFLDAMLRVLLRREWSPGVEQREIQQESFPFDRLLHIPLLVRRSGGGRLFYARTQIGNQQDRPDLQQSLIDWDALTSRECYRQIRCLGRVWSQRGGTKWASGQVFGVEPEEVREANGQLVRDSGLRQLVQTLVEPRRLNSLIRRLYEANALQSLAVGGLLVEIIERLLEAGLARPADRLHQARERLRDVIGDCIRVAEQAAGGEGEGGIFTSVLLDQDVTIQEWRPGVQIEEEPSLFRVIGNTEILPGWYEFFRAAEPPERSADLEAFAYGLHADGQPAKSKVFYIYYTFQAPDTFTGQEDPWVRGIFALVVDDAATDRKNEIADTADQQNIRTFVHNAVRSLSAACVEQGLWGQLRKPGVERSILGILHRLKNELSHPVVVLQDLEERARVELPEEARRIQSAIGTITGLGELFEGLRNLSEIEQGVVPLQTFSSDWLGWLFVARLAAWIHKQTQLLEDESRETVLRVEKKLGPVAKRAAEALRSETFAAHNLESIQRALWELEEVCLQVAKILLPKLPERLLLFSFQVFATAPLRFVGSFLLEEALTILVENAFQAFWDRLTWADGQQPEIHLIKLVCRRASIEAEIFLELTNTCRPLDKAIEAGLNSEVPQLMTWQHRQRSGKRDGSGFGHYYARRIVSEFCGGPERRVQLDVTFTYDQGAGAATSLIRLLRSGSGKVEPLLPRTLATALSGFFGDRGDFDVDAAKGQFFLPTDLPLAGLLEVCRRLLQLDRQNMEAKFFQASDFAVCCQLADACVDFLDQFIAAVQRLCTASGNAGEQKKWRQLLEQLEDDERPFCRRGSFLDLQRLLGDLRKHQSTPLQKIVDQHGGLEAKLERFLAGEPLAAQDFIDRDLFAQQMAPFSSYLAIDIDGGLETVIELLEEDDYGRPILVRKHLEALIQSGRWAIRCHNGDGFLHVGIFLVDGDPKALHLSRNPSGGMKTGGEFLARFQPFGRTFRDYTRSLRETPLANATAAGDLWLELDLPQPGEKRTPTRIVHLLLNDGSRQRHGGVT